MKKLITFFTVVLLLLCLNTNSFGQASTYVWSQSSGTFTTETPSGTPAALFITAWDDETALAQALGYTFNFAGNAFTTISISANGFIVMGSALTPNGSGSAYRSTGNTRTGFYLAGTSTNNGVAGMNHDLQEQTFPIFIGTRVTGSPVITGVTSFANLKIGMRLSGNGIASGVIIIALDSGLSTVTMSANATAVAFTQVTPRSSILITTTGSSPNRTTIVQWIAARRFGTASNEDNIDFQIRLNEGGGLAVNQTIQSVYGNATTTSTQTGAQVGIRTTTADINARATTTDWSATTVAASNQDTCQFSSTVNPASGLTYTWTPDTQPPCDVRPTANVTPTGVLSACGNTVAPKATVKNVGGATQTGIGVTYSITGPVSYSNTKTITSLDPDSSITVTFDSTFVKSTVGSYAVKIWTTLACDTAVSNDTLVSSFQIVQPNYGGPFMSCPYFFANSTPCAAAAPDQPIYFWEDTSGSTYLTVDGVATTPLTTGSLDDGAWRIDLVPILPVGDKIRFCGVCYDTIVIGTNGIIGYGPSLTAMTTFTPLSIPSTAAARPAAFPLWYDLNWGDADVTVKSLGYKVSGQNLIITYTNAPHFNGAADPNDYVTFQVILEIGIACGTADGIILAQYDDTQSGSTFLTRNNNNFPADSITVGIQNAAGTEAIQYKRTVNGVVKIPGAGPLFSSPLAVAFGPNGQALPVELSAFTSSINRRDVTLNWTTSTESNNSGFDVERSILNGQWSKIGNVSGNGTSNSSHSYSYNDRGLSSGKYNYRLKQIDFNGNFKYYNLSNEVNVGVPTKFDLSQNYPNPFNPTTKINYDLPFDGKVTMKIFDMSGREIATLINEVKTAGYHTLNFNGTNLSSSVYFYRISADANGQSFVSTKKMLLIK